MAEFKFDYGVVVFKNRFSIVRSLDDYKETVLNKCISMHIQFFYKTMARDKLFTKMVIIYKDDKDELHSLCKDLHDFTFCIKHKGDMQVNL